MCQAQGGVCARRSACSKRRAAASVASEAQLGEACDTTLVRSLILANMPSTILPLSENLRRGAWREGRGVGAVRVGGLAARGAASPPSRLAAASSPSCHPSYTPSHTAPFREERVCVDLDQVSLLVAVRQPDGDLLGVGGRVGVRVGVRVRVRVRAPQQGLRDGQPNSYPYPYRHPYPYP